MALKGRPLSVAIVGAGLMGRWHAHAAAQAGARVTAVVDRDFSRAQELAGKTRGGRPYRELGEWPDTVDVVHVCTPAATHVPLARLALESGCHVLVEKPLAPSAGAVGDLLDAAASAGRLLCPVHQFLFQDGFEAAVARLAAIGPLQHVEITICSAGADGFDSANRQRVALEVLPHPLSLLLRLLPSAADDLDWSILHPAPGELRALTQAGGVTASIVVSMRGRPTVNQVEIIGANGSTRVDLFHGFGVTWSGAVSRTRKAARPFAEAATLTAAAAANLARRAWRREPAYPGLRKLIERFHHAAASGGASPVTPAETLAAARACDRIAELLR